MIKFTQFFELNELMITSDEQPTPASLTISVHVPKTGGTSFQRILKEIYGRGFQEDYRWTAGRPDWVRLGPGEMSDEQLLAQVGETRCVHGHFLVSKYLRLRNVVGLRARFVTWLRDPIERAVSTYWFLRTLGTPEHQQQEWERKAKTLDIDAFFRTTPFGANRQAGQLRGVSLSEFAFIGITERYNESIELFLHDFAPDVKKIAIPHEHRNKNRLGAQYEIDPSLRDLLREQNDQDFALYREACELFEQRYHAALGRSG